MTQSEEVIGLSTTDDATTDGHNLIREDRYYVQKIKLSSVEYEKDYLEAFRLAQRKKTSTCGYIHATNEMIPCFPLHQIFIRLIQEGVPAEIVYKYDFTRAQKLDEILNLIKDGRDLCSKLLQARLGGDTFNLNNEDITDLQEEVGGRSSNQLLKGAPVRGTSSANLLNPKQRARTSRTVSAVEVGRLPIRSSEQPPPVASPGGRRTERSLRDHEKMRERKTRGGQIIVDDDIQRSERSFRSRKSRKSRKLPKTKDDDNKNKDFEGMLENGGDIDMDELEELENRVDEISDEAKSLSRQSPDHGFLPTVQLTRASEGHALAQKRMLQPNEKNPLRRLKSTLGKPERRLSNVSNCSNLSQISATSCYTSKSVKKIRKSRKSMKIRETAAKSVKMRQSAIRVANNKERQSQCFNMFQEKVKEKVTAKQQSLAQQVWSQSRKPMLMTQPELHPEDLEREHIPDKVSSMQSKLTIALDEGPCEVRVPTQILQPGFRAHGTEMITGPSLAFGQYKMVSLIVGNPGQLPVQNQNKLDPTLPIRKSNPAKSASKGALERSESKLSMHNMMPELEEKPIVHKNTSIRRTSCIPPHLASLYRPVSPNNSEHGPVKKNDYLDGVEDIALNNGIRGPLIALPLNISKTQMSAIPPIPDSSHNTQNVDGEKRVTLVCKDNITVDPCRSGAQAIPRIVLARTTTTKLKDLAAQYEKEEAEAAKLQSFLNGSKTKKYKNKIQIDDPVVHQHSFPHKSRPIRVTGVVRRGPSIHRPNQNLLQASGSQHDHVVRKRSKLLLGVQHDPVVRKSSKLLLGVQMGLQHDNASRKSSKALDSFTNQQTKKTHSEELNKRSSKSVDEVYENNNIRLGSKSILCKNSNPDESHNPRQSSKSVLFPNEENESLLHDYNLTIDSNERYEKNECDHHMPGVPNIKVKHFNRGDTIFNSNQNESGTRVSDVGTIDMRKSQQDLGEGKGDVTSKSLPPTGLQDIRQSTMARTTSVCSVLSDYRTSVCSNAPTDLIFNGETKGRFGNLGSISPQPDPRSTAMTSSIGLNFSQCDPRATAMTSSLGLNFSQRDPRVSAMTSSLGLNFSQCDPRVSAMTSCLGLNLEEPDPRVSAMTSCLGLNLEEPDLRATTNNYDLPPSSLGAHDPPLTPINHTSTNYSPHPVPEYTDLISDDTPQHRVKKSCRILTSRSDNEEIEIDDQSEVDENVKEPVSIGKPVIVQFPNIKKMLEFSDPYAFYGVRPKPPDTPPPKKNIKPPRRQLMYSDSESGSSSGTGTIDTISSLSEELAQIEKTRAPDGFMPGHMSAFRPKKARINAQFRPKNRFALPSDLIW